MSGIDPIKTGASRIVAKTLGAISKSKPIKKLTGGFQGNYADALAWTTVGSIVLKDGIGCYKYVTQSLNNDKIPEKRRSFVTSMDLTNGVLMICTQLAMFGIMRKFSEPMFNKFFKKSFNPKTKSEMLTKLRMEASKEGKELRKVDVGKNYEGARDKALELFKFVFDVGVATIIGKRILTPFAATPLAKVVEDKVYPILVKFRKDNKGHKDNNESLKEEFVQGQNVKDVEYTKIEKLEDKIDELEDIIEDKFETND